MSPNREIPLPKGMSFSSSDLSKGKALNIEILQPLPAVKAERHYGVVKSFNSNSGFGFIECKLSNDKYSRDVFLHKAQAGEIEVGTVVEFAIDINERGMPQAREVRQLDDGTDEAKRARTELKEGSSPSTSSPSLQDQQTQLQQQQRDMLQLQQQVLMASAMPQFPVQQFTGPQMMYQPVMIANSPTPMLYHVPVMVPQTTPGAFLTQSAQLQQLQSQQPQQPPQ